LSTPFLKKNKKVVAIRKCFGNELIDMDFELCYNTKVE